jgi:IS5 family transposase
LVKVDTTVHPQLLRAAIKGQIRLARKHGVRLRQSYHAIQSPHRELRTLRTRLGRITRDITRVIGSAHQIPRLYQLRD